MSARIADTDFLDRLDRRQVLFGSGDALDVEIGFKQNYEADDVAMGTSALSPQADISRYWKRAKLTAKATAQWRSNPSPPIVSSKTGISAVRAGDFRGTLVKVADFRSSETIRIYANSPENAGFSHRRCQLSLVE